MADVVYTATLDDKAVQAALKEIVVNTRRTADAADKAWSQVDKGAKTSGASIGVTSGIVQELTRRLINLAAQAVSTFEQITKKGIELNQSAEQIEIALTQIFEGNRAAALAFLDTVDETAVKLGINREELRGLAKSILPDVGDIDKTNKILEQMIVLGRDAAQNMTSIRIAVEEALASGGERAGLISLQRRLNIPPAAIDRIVELSKQIGLTDALIEVLGQRIQKAGLNLEDYGDSFTMILGQAQSELTVLNKTFGEAPFDELKEQIKGFLEVFEERRDDIEFVAKMFGQIVAAIIDITGAEIQELLASFDVDQIQAFATALFDVTNQAGLLIDLLSDTDAAEAGLGGITSDLELIADVLKTINDLIRPIKAFFEASATEEVLISLSPVGLADPRKAFEALKAIQEEGIFDQEKYQEALAKTGQAVDEAAQREEDYAKVLDERGKKTREVSEADKAAGEAIIQHKKMLEDLSRAEAEAAKAQEKINTELSDTAKEAGQRLNKILRDQQNQRLEDAIKNAEKRADIERKNLDKVEDIYRDYQRDQAKVLADLPEQEAKIAKDAARDRAEIERDKGKAILDAERNFQRELRRIREQFNQSALEAERNNDAQAYLQAARTAEQQKREAEIRRDEDIEDAKTTAGERRQELKTSLEQEIQDAKEANQKKLADLNEALEEQLQDQQIARERNLRDQEIAEQRQAEQRQRANQQELEEFHIKEAQKLADLKASLETEFAMISAYNQKKKEAARETADYLIAQARRAFASLPSISGPGRGGGSAGSAPASQGGSFGATPLRTFQHGGYAPGGGPIIVGEQGPEVLVLPPGGGYVHPSIQDYINQPRNPAMGGNRIFNDNRQSSISMPVQESIINNPVARTLFKQLAREVIAETL